MITLLVLEESNAFGVEIKRLKDAMSEGQRLILLEQFAKHILPEYAVQLKLVLNESNVEKSWIDFFVKYKSKTEEEAKSLYVEFKQNYTGYITTVKKEQSIELVLNDFNIDSFEATSIFKTIEYGVPEIPAAKMKEKAGNGTAMLFVNLWKSFCRSYGIDIEEFLLSSVLEGD